MADQQVKITISAIDNATKALNDIKKSLTGISKETDTTQTSFLSLKNVVIGFATVTAVVLTKRIIEATKTFQDLRSNLITATGSIEQGTQAFKYLTEFSKKTQFSVEDITKAFLTLYQNGVQPTEKILTTFTTVAGNATNKLDTLNDLVVLFAKGAQNAGIGAQTLTQLVKNNIPVYEILQKQLGISSEGVNKLFDSSTTAKIALDALLVGLEQRAKKASNRVDNLSTRMDLFTKSTQQLLAEIGETTSLNYFFDTLNEGFERNKPLLQFLGNLLVGVINVVAFIAGTANKVMFDFFEMFSFYLKPLKSMADTVYDTLTPAFSWLTKQLNNATKAWEALKKISNAGSKSLMTRDTFESDRAVTTGKLPDEPKATPKATELQEIVSTTSIDLLKVLESFEKISVIISKGVATGIKDVSKTLAESVVLGKSLQMSFREIAQNLLVKILAGLIEQNLIKLALLALDEISSILGIKQLYTESLKTKELEKQAKLKKEINGEVATQEVKPEEMAKQQLTQIIETLWGKLKETFDTVLSSVSTIFESIGTFTTEIFNSLSKNLSEIVSSLAENLSSILSSLGGGSSGGGGFLSSLINIGMSAFGGGGAGGAMPDLPMGMYAEGGAVRGGMPITVGERGRELFVPNTNGTVVPNHDLGGANNITFNIQANDVRGIKELLIDNRATIINLVNQGANQKGKSNIV
jgi:hypothetical protein